MQKYKQLEFLFKKYYDEDILAEGLEFHTYYF